MTDTLPWGATDTTPVGFTEDRLTRARKRLARGAVSPNGTGRTWNVAGDAKLGDSYPSYKVGRAEGEVHYHCSCYDHTGGDSRGRRICSHVKAVILWRGTPDGKRWAWRQEMIAKAKERREARVSEVLSGPDQAGDVGSEQQSPAELLGSEVQGTSPSHAPLPSDPRHPSWGQLPGWLEAWRPHQLTAMDEVLDGYRSGKRVMFVEAPTGAGKSGLAVGVARQLGTRALYLASTKTLQDQIERDQWPGARILKGRSNYPTLEGWGDGTGWGDVTCADCSRQPGSDSCRWCPEVLACPYSVAKAGALASDLTVLNYAYALTDWNLARGSFAGRGLAILDEGDVLESELMGFVEVSLSKRQLGELKLAQPGRKGLPQGELVQPEWERWVREDALPAVKKTVGRFAADRYLEVKEIRVKKRLQELARKLKQLAEELPAGGWVYTDYESGAVTFKPVKVDRYAEAHLWRHAQRHLVMSATIISADEQADSLGLADGEWGLVHVPSTFPVANRPIRVCKVANMSYKNRAVAWPKMAQAVSGIVRIHPGERTLIHSHTYDFAKVVVKRLRAEHLGRPIITFTSSAGRPAAMEEYLRTPGSVLVGPGMERGIDGKDDAVRVNVQVKVPYPYLGDKQVSARMYAPSGRNWYTVQTVRAMVQTTGRGFRHEGDAVTNYVLDSAFVDNLWSSSARRLFPKFWTEALDWQFPVNTILEED